MAYGAVSFVWRIKDSIQNFFFKGYYEVGVIVFDIFTFYSFPLYYVKDILYAKMWLLGFSTTDFTFPHLKYIYCSSANKVLPLLFVNFHCST